MLRFRQVSCQFYQHFSNSFLCKSCFFAFMSLQFGFVIFWHKKIGTKAARKMLVKLTTGVNFINILHKSFLYKSKLSSFSQVTFGFVIFLCQIISKKCALKMLMKFTPGQPQLFRCMNIRTTLRRCSIQSLSMLRSRQKVRRRLRNVNIINNNSSSNNNKPEVENLA